MSKLSELAVENRGSGDKLFKRVANKLRKFAKLAASSSAASAAKLSSVIKESAKESVRLSLEALMPTFDVVSEVDKHELTNAVDQANRELANRFDFKDSAAQFELDGFIVIQAAPSAFQLKQMLDILRGRLSARGIDTRCMEFEEPATNVSGARQKITIRQGIEQAVAKKLIAAIKGSKLKVEAQINGDKLRVSSKKRDDLQSVIALLRKTDVELPLQFQNFRD